MILQTLGSVGHAADDATCEAYARGAVAQQQVNLSLGCGFTGGAWVSEAESHRAWCLGPDVTDQWLVDQNNARSTALEQCRANPPTRQAEAAPPAAPEPVAESNTPLTAADCDAYSADAVAQQETNLSLGCGFTGGAWVSEQESHRAWCLGPDVTRQWLIDQTSARTAALETCRANAPPPTPEPTVEAAAPSAPPDGPATAADCQAYAISAVAQATENRHLNCGLTGGAWQAEAQNHINWCMSSGTTLNMLRGETDKREQALAACRADPPAPPAAPTAGGQLATLEPEAPAVLAPTCDAYAAQALAQAAANVSLGCGLTGGAWLQDAEAHRSWCMSEGVTGAMLVGAEADRSKALDQCRAKGSVCARYATLAAAQGRENQDLGCGLIGEDWSEDVNVHRAQCIGQPYTASLGAAGTRHEALRVCATRLPGFQRTEAMRHRRILADLLRQFTASIPAGAQAADTN